MRLLAAAFALIGLLAGLGDACPQDQSSWNGTWIGNWENGDGTQIVFAGDELISIYWGGDYQSEVLASISADHKVVTISWASVQATLTRDGEATGHIVLRQPGKPDLAFAVNRDNQ
jgi:hypothetical protein